MRLLNVCTLEFRETYNDPGLHAILSHTWEDEEVTFEDMVASTISTGGQGRAPPDGRPAVVSAPASSKAGFKKLMGFCDKARGEGFVWVWMDTCCINKSSSAELSEAINAMFAWYSKASVCYAYLCDVPPGGDPAAPESTFRKSRWFTRGWTLQELIAPTEVVFLASDWSEIGSRHSLAWLVSEITGIDDRVLCEPRFRADFSLAQRMSWAADRATTRVEDIAYCLLGLFDVNMPLLYGEGDKAFIRLQQEILAGSDDSSILAWVPAGEDAHLIAAYTPCNTPGTNVWLADTGLLATSPDCFHGSAHIGRLPQSWPFQGKIAARLGLRSFEVTIRALGGHLELELPVFGLLGSQGAGHGVISRPKMLLPHTFVYEHSYRYRPRQPERKGPTGWTGWTGWTGPTHQPEEPDCEKFTKYRSSKIMSELSPDGSWDRISMALVGAIRCRRQGPCQHHFFFKPYGDGSCTHTRYIGVLLDSSAGRLVTRVHYPPLVVMDLNEAVRLGSSSAQELLWTPLSRIKAATSCGVQRPLTPERDDSQPVGPCALLMAVPGGYHVAEPTSSPLILRKATYPSIMAILHGKAEWGERLLCENFTYDPDLDASGAATPYISNHEAQKAQHSETNFPTVMEFSCQTSRRPTFVLFFKWDSSASAMTWTSWWDGPSMAGLFVGSLRDHPAVDLSNISWTDLHWHEKALLPLTETEAVCIRCRRAPGMDLYYIGIEAVTPAPLPPTPSAAEVRGLREEFTGDSLPDLLPGEDNEFFDCLR